MGTAASALLQICYHFLTTLCPTGIVNNFPRASALSCIYSTLNNDMRCWKWHLFLIKRHSTTFIEIQEYNYELVSTFSPTENT